jgi:cytoskeletal protein RodZ
MNNMSEVSKKLGSYIKSKREAKGKSIEDIAEVLKITPINIMNIENGNMDSIGLSEIFVRSYIKSYISELGESPDDVFNKFYDFQRDEHTKIGKDINESTIFYNPFVLILSVMVFFIISYFFISSIVRNNTSMLDVNGTNQTSMQENENNTETKGNFSRDYDNTYSNYSETTR